MLSSRTLVPVCLYVYLLLATTSYAQIHDLSSGGHVKRLLKKRAPLPQDGGILGGGPLIIAGAGAIPSSTAVASSTSVSSTPSSSSASSSVSSISSTSASSDASSSASSTSASSTSTSQTSSASSTSSSSSTPVNTPPPAQTSEALNLDGQQAQQTIVSTVIPTVTQTQSVAAAKETEGAPAPLGAAAKSTGTTMTALIAAAAAVGGIAILWTIFRKWKLSSSKKFDQRLNPINWQPTTGEDDVIPNHRRVPSTSSARTGTTRRADPLDHDFTAGPANNSPVGGYADLSRGPSPTMQENLSRGPSLNRGYEFNSYNHSTGNRY